MQLPQHRHRRCARTFYTPRLKAGGQARLRGLIILINIYKIPGAMSRNCRDFILLGNFFNVFYEKNFPHSVIFYFKKSVFKFSALLADFGYSEFFCMEIFLSGIFLGIIFKKT